MAVLSHHLPAEYDGHTLNIGGLRLCARCSGILLGVALIIAHSLFRFSFIPGVSIWLIALLPLPAAANFTLHHLGILPSNSPLRFLTGIMLGFSVGYTPFYFIDGSLFHGITLSMWLIALQIIVALILQWTGKLAPLMEHYEEKVYKATH